MQKLIPALVAGLFFLMAGNAQAGAYLTPKGVVAAPFGLILLCSEVKRVCAKSTPATITLTEAARQRIEKINAAVNASITYSTKDEVYWQVEPKFGDCEDYALTKRERLVSAGFPRGALTIAIVSFHSPGDHAVLLVHTDQGDMVLDSRKIHGKAPPNLLSLSSTPYRFMMRSSPADPKFWDTL